MFRPKTPFYPQSQKSSVLARSWRRITISSSFSGDVGANLRIPKSSEMWSSTFIDQLGFVPLSKTDAELLFEVFSQHYEHDLTLVTSNTPFLEWAEVLGSERLTSALLDRLTHPVHILEMNGESYRLKQSKQKRSR
jgi:DNA replication protein DnaC